MKKLHKCFGAIRSLTGFCLLALFSLQLYAQETDTVGIQLPPSTKKRPVKNTFESNWILDNQSVMVPIKGTFEMDIQHRFGVVNNGYKDLFGIYAPSNIRMGFSYVLMNDLQVGLGFTKERLQWDLNGKYSIIKQTKGSYPVSVSWFSNVVFDTRSKENFVNFGDRISYFHQLLIARKVTDKLSVQVAPSISHYNNIEGYLDSEGKVQRKMKNDHLAIAFMARYRITEKTNLIVNYDQPLTEHPMNNPHPNISFGLEMVTSSHAFQVFFGNYQGITPQSNNLYNKNDFRDGQFCIGFNISRLWNF